MFSLDISMYIVLHTYKHFVVHPLPWGSFAASLTLTAKYMYLLL